MKKNSDLKIQLNYSISTVSLDCSNKQELQILAQLKIVQASDLRCVQYSYILGLVEKQTPEYNVTNKKRTNIIFSYFWPISPRTQIVTNL
ncbi:MAG: hypothetical protein ACI9DQ_000416 [Glaciecola sp.]|jgi:hypothetical protein